MSSLYRRILEEVLPCTRCLTSRLTVSGICFHKVRTTRRYGSGVAQAKPHWGNRNVDRPHWKKKERKLSSENQIHHELLKVLNKRAEQLILNRETHQLHRVLVTNFSFMDFPVQLSSDAGARYDITCVPVLSKTQSETHENVSGWLSDREWLQQFTDFHLQMSAVARRAGQEIVSSNTDRHNLDIGVAGDREAKAVNYVSSSSAKEPQVRKREQDSVEIFSKVKDTRDEESKNIRKTATSRLQKHDITRTDLLPSSRQQLQKPVQPTTASKPSKSKTVKHTVMAVDAREDEVLFSEDFVVVNEMDSAFEYELVEEEKVMQSEELDVKKTETITKEYRKTSKSKSVLPKVDKKMQKNEAADVGRSQQDDAMLAHVFNQEILAFVESCCFVGLESMAHNRLKVTHYHHLTSCEQKGNVMWQVPNIAVYNCLMRAWAKKGQLSDIKNLFTLIRKENLHPNLQSYAACLECLGRRADIDLAIGSRILDDIQREGLDIREIFNTCIFSKDEREVIHKVILTLDPDYVPASVSDSRPPSGPLLDDLDTAWPNDKVVEKNPYAGVLSTDQLYEKADTQLQREIGGFMTVKSILERPNPSSRTLDCRKKLECLKEEWSRLLTKALHRKLRVYAGNQKMDFSLTLYPFLKILPPQEYVQCILQVIEDFSLSSESYSPTKLKLFKQLGSCVFSKYVVKDKVQSKVPKKVLALYKEYLNDYNNPDLELDSHRQRWQTIMNKMQDGPSLDLPEKIWPDCMLRGLGRVLYDLILTDLKINENILKGPDAERKMVRAFYSLSRSRMGKVMEEIKVHPVLLKLYKGAEIDELRFDTTFLPMVVPPLPWVSTGHGGYLLSAVRLVRLPSEAQVQVDKVQEKVADAKFFSVLDAVNTLSACAWMVNKQVLDLIIEIFNKKGDPSLDVPSPASECPAPPKIMPSMSPQEKAKVIEQHQKHNSQKADMHSLWCQELYRLSIANKFREDIFWFPHNLDFRGRTYPFPPHFNHLGSDVTRGILLFAKGKPLGPNGLDWLKVHLINLTGLKKRGSNAERLALANHLMPEILDSAERPLTGKKWWQKSDKPWQTLASCIEVAKAVQCSCPEDYICHLPIHQDGSCNGLQHYSALGRDQSGAQSVNLWPYDKPQDVYSDVCELIEKERAKDALEGVKIAQVLEGFVRRKVIKQTVMTTVYGVTRYGAKQQILRQLKDIPEFPSEHLWAGSRYLMDKTFHCLHEMFSATKDIQNWLTLSAQLITTVCQQPVEWVTPLGLPVVQPYHHQQSQKRFNIQSFNTCNYFEKPNTMKQKNAFPPNFIHSLDSTHMMLTALYCLRAGITFVSVHDCFWTHACDVAIMNKICRSQFVALHKQPILEDLSQQLINRYTPVEETEEKSVVKERDFLRRVLSSVPSRGSFDVDKVLESTYFFS